MTVKSSVLYRADPETGAMVPYSILNGTIKTIELNLSNVTTPSAHLLLDEVIPMVMSAAPAYDADKVIWVGVEA